MEKWKKLSQFECPAAECQGVGNREKKFNWVCSKDSTTIYISQKGNMRCDKKDIFDSYEHIGPIITWRWNCGRHNQHQCDGYRSGDFQAFTFTLAIAGLHMKRWGASFCGDLMKAIGEQYGMEDGDSGSDEDNT